MPASRTSHGVWRSPSCQHFCAPVHGPRSTLYHRGPCGPENDQALLTVVRGAGIVICAWGSHGRYRERGATVQSLLQAQGIPLHALRLNKDGSPQHPLYIGYDVVPFLLGSA